MFHRIFNLLKVPAPIEPIQDKEKANKLYKHFRRRNLYSMVIGYAVFYFVRKNLAMAQPIILAETGITKSEIGLVLTICAIVYGFGKFANGMFADRLNSRYFMALGLLCSAIVNVFFGLSSSLIFFGVFWIVNHWFQSMGMPPSVRLLTHWFSPTELGTKWAIQSTAHQIGGAGILILTGSVLIPYFGWRAAFFGPAIIATLAAFWLLNRLRDNPRSMGLPPVEVYRGDVKEAKDNRVTLPIKEILFQHVLNNKYIWIMAIANCFVYVARMGIMDWAPTYLYEARGSTISGAAFKTAAFELAGIAGCLLCGWLSDHSFKGRRGPLGAVCMLILAVTLASFIFLPVGHPLVETFLLIIAGILVYGPQLLVPVAVADFATKKAAATATGFTGWTGYVGAAISGVGTGMIADKWGWDAGMGFFAGCAFLGALCFMLIWNKRSPQLEEHHARLENEKNGCCDKMA